MPPVSVKFWADRLPTRTDIPKTTTAAIREESEGIITELWTLIPVGKNQSNEFIELIKNRSGFDP
jgi:hypothetical protein